jgi:catechol 2,3-dioxygenase-like lactoylglutathione lyase family enzyme
VSPAPALHHAALRCRDLERAERFYRDVLGLEVLRRWPRAGSEGGGERSVWLALGGGGFLALERADAGDGLAEAAAAREPFGAAPAGWHVVALSMDRADRAAWEARLASAGIALEKRTRFSVFFRDPEGNRIALSHWPEAIAEPLEASR